MARLINTDKTAEVLTKYLLETALNNSGEASMMCVDIAENRLKTWIDLIPTESEPIQHGHWEHGKDVIGMYYQCSECGSQYHIGYEFNYCPECGAKMDEVNEDETD